MKASAEIQSTIREKFQELHTKEDLLCLLNLVKPVVFGEKTKLFNLNQLTYYYSTRKHVIKYKTFSITKKSGNQRIIHAPVPGLKAIQRTLAYILEMVYEPHHAAYGFRKELSVADNAAKHVGSRYVYNIDLKDFFPSVDQARVWKCLQLKPFSLKSKKKKELSNQENPEINNLNKFDGEFVNTSRSSRIRFNYEGLNLLSGNWEIKNKEDRGINYVVSVGNIRRDKGFIYFNFSDLLNKDAEENKKITKNDINAAVDAIIEHQESLLNSIPLYTPASIIAALCCMNMEVERKNDSGEWVKMMKNVLPQGAPTSPIMTNIICKRLDILLSGLAKRFRLKYSRYADDITFSSEHNVYQRDSEFVKELNRIIIDQGFEIKDNKTRLQKTQHRQEVTGLLVNRKINVQKRYIKQLRTWIHLLEKKSYGVAARIIVDQYIKDKGNVKSDRIKIENLIRGKLAYLRMIKGRNSSQYVKLKDRLESALKKRLFKEKNPEKIAVDTISTDNTSLAKKSYMITDPATLLDDIIEKGLDKAFDENEIDF